MVAVVAAVAAPTGVAVREHNRAEFWEFNSARRASYVRNLEVLSGLVAFRESAPRIKDNVLETPEIEVRLRDPRPGRDCWLEGEWSRSVDNLEPTRTVVR